MKTKFLTLSILSLLFVFGLASCQPDKQKSDDTKATPAVGVSDSAGASASAAEGSQTPTKTAPNMLTFEKMEHDFGNLVTGSPVTYTFKFKNTHDKPVKIENVKPSCGCTTPDYTKDVVPVGAEGFVKVEYNNKSAGKISKSVTVSAVSVPEGEVYNEKLKFKAEATEK